MLNKDIWEKILGYGLITLVGIGMIGWGTMLVYAVYTIISTMDW